MSMSAPQLTAQRAGKRWKNYFLAISSPATVYTARINQPGGFASLDNIVSLPFDGGSGTIGNVLPGMTCFVGTSAGAYDVGIVRVRLALSATPLPIGKTSGIAFDDNQYLTIIKDFNIWPREPSISGGVTVIDEDVQFSQVASFAPIVKIGPAALVLERVAGTVTHTPTATGIFPTGLSAASYQWSAASAFSITDDTTATATITYHAAGEFMESCQITDTAGAVGIAYRKVFVDPPTTAKFSMDAPVGAVDTGGWSVHIEGYSGVDLASLRDGAMCVLWKHDHKGTALDSSYGKYLDAENIRLIGWLDGQSLTVNPQFGTASFTIQGPSYWLDKIPGAPATLTDVNPPQNWDNLPAMTTDMALYRLLWQTTLPQVCDITLTGDTTRISSAIINSGSIRGQINTLATEKLLAQLRFDRFGCGFVFTPVSFLETTPRGAVDVLMDIAASDWLAINPGERITVPPSSMVEIGGSAWDGLTEIQLYSRAPGNTQNPYGASTSPYSQLAFDAQVNCNRRSGDILAHDNNEFPAAEIELHWANDFVDIAPAMVLRLGLTAAQTPRGIVWTNKRIVPLSITYNYDKVKFIEGTKITFETETDGADGITFYPPQPVSGSMNITFHTPNLSFQPAHLPNFGTWFPPVLPANGFPANGTPCYDVATGPFTLAFDIAKMTGLDTVLYSRCYFPCKIRASTAVFKSSFSIPIRWAENSSPTAIFDAMSSFHAYAIDDAGNHILTGTVSAGDNEYFPTVVSFNPVGNTDVAGFELTLDAGAGPGPFGYTAKDIVSSGTVNATDSVGVIMSGMTNGNYYATDDTGGPWWSGISWEYDGTPDPLDVTIIQNYPRDALGHTRHVFQKPSGDVHFRVDDSFFPDNTGTLSYNLRNVERTGVRAFALGPGTLVNVCAIG